MSVYQLLDQAESESALDSAEVKRLLLQFEKRVAVNQQKRMKYSEDPEKFMASEVQPGPNPNPNAVRGAAPHSLTHSLTTHALTTRLVRTHHSLTRWSSTKPSESCTS